MKLIFWSRERTIKHYIAEFKQLGMTIQDATAFNSYSCFFIIDENMNVSAASYAQIVEYVKTNEYKLASYEDIMKLVHTNNKKSI